MVNCSTGKVKLNTPGDLDGTLAEISYVTTFWIIALLTQMRTRYDEMSTFLPFTTLTRILFEIKRKQSAFVEVAMKPRDPEQKALSRTKCKR